MGKRLGYVVDGTMDEYGSLPSRGDLRKRQSVESALSRKREGRLTLYQSASRTILRLSCPPGPPL